MGSRLEDEEMKRQCPFCPAGVMSPSTSSMLLERDGLTVVVKGVPAETCGSCGEPYFSADVTSRVLAIGEDAVRRGVVLEVLQYAA